MTVGELIDYLSKFERNEQVLIDIDKGRSIEIDSADYIKNFSVNLHPARRLTLS